MGSAASTIWEANTKQDALISCPVEDVFYGGAMGGGKSDGLLGDFFFHQLDYPQHARGLLIRRTYPELLDLIMRSMEVYEPFGAVWNWARYMWTFPGGARLRMGHLERETDVQRHMGPSYTWIGIDEVTHYPESRQLDRLRSRLRSAHGVPCYFRCTGNPGFAGHNWVKMRYVDPHPQGMVPFTQTQKIGGIDTTVERVYIPATLEDNPYLSTDYEQQMALATTGQEELFLAWRYGRWDIVAGGMFDDLWDDEVHYIDPFPIPQKWHVDRTHDWGSAKPFATLWFAESDGWALPDGRQWPKGTLFIVSEDYGMVKDKPNEGLRLGPFQIGQRTAAHQKALIEGGVLSGIVHPGAADDPLFDTSRGAAMADDYAKAGMTWRRPAKGPGSRVTKWTRIRTLLQHAVTSPHEEPGLYVFTTCPQFRRTFVTLPRDKKKPDDVDTDAEDHLADALGLRVLQHRGKVTTGKLSG